MKTNLSSVPSPGHAGLDPNSLDEFIGQGQLIRELIPEAKAALQERRALASMCFYGPPGTGKSSLANLLARVRGVNVLRFQGSKVQQKDFDVAFGADTNPSIPPSMRVNREGYAKRFDPKYGGLRWVRDGNPIKPSLLLFDEWELCKRQYNQNLHDVPMPVDEEGNRYFQTTRNGRSVDIFCPEITMILVTNDMDKLLKNGEALVSRCQIKHRFDLYSVEELHHILLQFAIKSAIKLEDRAAYELADKAKGTPRQALHLFRKAQNVLSAQNYDKKTDDNHISFDMVQEAFGHTGTDHQGLGDFERRYLMLLYQAENKTLPLETLSTILGESTNTIANVLEPDLMRMGMVTRYQGRGRMLTHKGVSHIQQYNQMNNNDDYDADMAVTERY